MTVAGEAYIVNYALDYPSAHRNQFVLQNHTQNQTHAVNDLFVVYRESKRTNISVDVNYSLKDVQGASLSLIATLHGSKIAVILSNIRIVLYNVSTVPKVSFIILRKMDYVNVFTSTFEFISSQSPVTELFGLVPSVENLVTQVYTQKLTVPQVDTLYGLAKTASSVQIYSCEQVFITDVTNFYGMFLEITSQLSMHSTNIDYTLLSATNVIGLARNATGMVLMKDIGLSIVTSSPNVIGLISNCTQDAVLVGSELALTLSGPGLVYDGLVGYVGGSFQLDANALHYTITNTSLFNGVSKQSKSVELTQTTIELNIAAGQDVNTIVNASEQMYLRNCTLRATFQPAGQEQTFTQATNVKNAALINVTIKNELSVSRYALINETDDFMAMSVDDDTTFDQQCQNFTGLVNKTKRATVSDYRLTANMEKVGQLNMMFGNISENMMLYNVVIGGRVNGTSVYVIAEELDGTAFISGFQQEAQLTGNIITHIKKNNGHLSAEDITMESYTATIEPNMDSLLFINENEGNIAVHNTKMQGSGAFLGFFPGTSTQRGCDQKDLTVNVQNVVLKGNATHHYIFQANNDLNNSVINIASQKITLTSSGYFSFFGPISSIENITINSDNFEVEGAEKVAQVFMETIGETTIKGCTFAARLSLLTSTSELAGIVHTVSHKLNLINSSFSGSLSSDGYASYVATLQTQPIEVVNCSISNPTIYMGMAGGALINDSTSTITIVNSTLQLVVQTDLFLPASALYGKIAERTNIITRDSTLQVTGTYTYCSRIPGAIVFDERDAIFEDLYCIPKRHELTGVDFTQKKQVQGANGTNNVYEVYCALADESKDYNNSIVTVDYTVSRVSLVAISPFCDRPLYYNVSVSGSMSVQATTVNDQSFVAGLSAIQDLATVTVRNCQLSVSMSSSGYVDVAPFIGYLDGDMDVINSSYSGKVQVANVGSVLASVIQNGTLNVDGLSLDVECVVADRGTFGSVFGLLKVGGTVVASNVEVRGSLTSSATTTLVENTGTFGGVSEGTFLSAAGSRSQMSGRYGGCPCGKGVCSNQVMCQYAHMSIDAVNAVYSRTVNVAIDNTNVTYKYALPNTVKYNGSDITISGGAFNGSYSVFDGAFAWYVNILVRGVIPSESITGPYYIGGLTCINTVSTIIHSVEVAISSTGTTSFLGAFIAVAKNTVSLTNSRVTSSLTNCTQIGGFSYAVDNGTSVEVNNFTIQSQLSAETAAWFTRKLGPHAMLNISQVYVDESSSLTSKSSYAGFVCNTHENGFINITNSEFNGSVVMESNTGYVGAVASDLANRMRVNITNTYIGGTMMCSKSPNAGAVLGKGEQSSHFNSTNVTFNATGQYNMCPQNYQNVNTVIGTVVCQKREFNIDDDNLSGGGLNRYYYNQVSIDRNNSIITFSGVSSSTVFQNANQEMQYAEFISDYDYFEGVVLKGRRTYAAAGARTSVAGFVSTGTRIQMFACENHIYYQNTTSTTHVLDVGTFASVISGNSLIAFCIANATLEVTMQGERDSNSLMCQSTISAVANLQQQSSTLTLLSLTFNNTRMPCRSQSQSLYNYYNLQNNNGQCTIMNDNRLQGGQKANNNTCSS